MRVCFVSTSYPRWQDDPAGHFVEKLARHVAGQEGVEVTVLCPGCPGAAAREYSEGFGVRRLRYFWPQRFQKLAYGAGIPWNLKRSLLAWLNIPFLLGVFFWKLCLLGGKAHIVHAHWGILGALACFTRPLHGCPVVLTIHGSDLRSTMAPIKWLTRWAIRHADAVITLSQEFWRDCCQVRKTSRACYLLPNGVDAPSPGELEAAREEFALPGRTMRTVSVGRLIPERRHDLLVRAFARVRQRFGVATLTLLGDGPQRTPLEDLVRKLGLDEAVTMTGQVPTSEVSRWLLSADLYVSPTMIDNFGTAVVEAAAHGLPIVTTRVGFPAELVVDGKGGFVVPPGDGQALADAMVKVLEDDPRRLGMGRFMRQRVDTLGLTWEACAARTKGVYEQLVGMEGKASATCAP